MLPSLLQYFQQPNSVQVVPITGSEHGTSQWQALFLLDDVGRRQSLTQKSSTELMKAV